MSDKMNYTDPEFVQKGWERMKEMLDQEQPKRFPWWIGLLGLGILLAIVGYQLYRLDSEAMEQDVPQGDKAVAVVRPVKEKSIPKTGSVANDQSEYKQLDSSDFESNEATSKSKIPNLLMMDRENTQLQKKLFHPDMPALKSYPLTAYQISEDTNRPTKAEAQNMTAPRRAVQKFVKLPKQKSTKNQKNTLSPLLVPFYRLVYPHRDYAKQISPLGLEKGNICPKIVPFGYLHASFNRLRFDQYRLGMGVEFGLTPKWQVLARTGYDRIMLTRPSSKAEELLFDQVADEQTDQTNIDLPPNRKQIASEVQKQLAYENINIGFGIRREIKSRFAINLWTQMHFPFKNRTRLNVLQSDAALGNQYFLAKSDFLLKYALSTAVQLNYRLHNKTDVFFGFEQYLTSPSSTFSAKPSRIQIGINYRF